MAIPLETTSSFFFFNDTATTEIYTLSLHDALPISGCVVNSNLDYPLKVLRVIDFVATREIGLPPLGAAVRRADQIDRKSTRLNSSHGYISYAVFCLKKKKPTSRRSSRYHRCRWSTL